jgi:hypothetical protein
VNLRAGPGKIYDIVIQARQSDTFPLLARTRDSEWLGVGYGEQVLWVASYLVQRSHDLEAIPTIAALPPTPTATPTPPLLPAPVVLEPEDGAEFGQDQVMRIKLTWLRKLHQDERLAIRVESVRDPQQFLDWRPTEEDILNGGGVSKDAPPGYLYEINYGLSSEDLPVGEASWKVAVFQELGPDSQRQVSVWSQQRQVFKE